MGKIMLTKIEENQSSIYSEDVDLNTLLEIEIDVDGSITTVRDIIKNLSKPELETFIEFVKNEMEKKS